MNVSQIKALTWLTAAGLGGLLGWTIYDRLPEFRQPGDTAWAQQEKAEKILNSVSLPEEAAQDLVPQAKIQEHFLDLNWTGRVIQAPVAVVEEEKAPEKPPEVPVADLVRILWIQEERLAPQRSQFYLLYKPASGVKAGTARASSGAASPPQATAARGARGAPTALATGTGSPTDSVDAMRYYRVGDHLLPPLEFIRVEKISAADGVTFAFEGSERSPETVLMQDVDPLEGLLVRTTREGAVRPERREGVPTGDRRVAFGERTTRVGENAYRLGLQDMEDIGQNYPSIISSEISHRSYVNPKTKEPGILLSKVQQGGFVWRHGGREGDIVKSVNGHPVGSLQEAITFAKNNSEVYTTWHVVVENMGQERTVTIESP